MSEHTLTEQQIASLMTAALEHNAAVVQLASLVYGKEMKPHYQKQVYKQFADCWERYGKNVRSILDVEGLLDE